jgi:spore coat protein CotH
MTWPLDCDSIFDPEVLPTLEVWIAEEDWNTLVYFYLNGYDLQLQGLNPKVYVPCTFRYGDEEVTDAAIRLRGNPCCSWYGTKMQFDISFTEYNPNGRFHGMRKLDLDAPPYDSTLLHNRIAFAHFADLGLPAICVNNARLNVNDAYYGLYALMEHMDKAFLERAFQEPEGNLYKYGYVKETNESDPDVSDMERFWATTDVAELATFVDLEEGVLEWAGEALLPDGDGYWAGSWNFYLYNHPTRGFLWIPWDMDWSLEVVPANADPLTWTTSWGVPQVHYAAVTSDPVWRDRYITALATARGAYDPTILLHRIDAWSEQIRTAIWEDPNLYVGYNDWVGAVDLLERHVSDRADFIDGWLEEQQ